MHTSAVDGHWNIVGTYRLQLAPFIHLKPRNISYLLFWYPITLGFQTPMPTTSEIGGPIFLGVQLYS